MTGVRNDNIPVVSESANTKAIDAPDYSDKDEQDSKRVQGCGGR